MSEPGKSNTGKIIGGCAAVAIFLFVAIGMGIYVVGKKGIDKVKAISAENQLLDDSLRAWAASTADGTKLTFPEQFAGFQKVSTTQVSSLPYINPEHAATEAAYKNGAADFKITAAKIENLDHSQVIDAALEAAKSRGINSHMKGSLPSYSRLSFSHKGKGYYIRGHSNGWLFVVEYDKGKGDAKELMIELFQAAAQ